MINLSLEWKTVELKSIADVTMGQSPKSEFYNDNFEGMPFLQGNKTFGDKYPSFELYTTSIKKVAKKSSVLMSVRAPVGDLNIAKEDICIGRGICGLQMKKGDNEFLYYLLKANISHLINKESGTVFGSINKNDIETFEVTLPEDFEDQMKILTILKNIDKKIEICKELNKNLEAIANNIFKNYFIDYEPFKNLTFIDTIIGNVPKEWEFTKIEDVIDVRDGTHDSPSAIEVGFPLITSKHLNKYDVNKNEANKISFEDYTNINKRSLVEPFDILISMIGTVGNICYIMYDEVDFAIKNVGLFKTSQTPLLREYLLLYLKSIIIKQYIDSRLAGSTQKYISLTELRNIPIVIPPREILEEFTNVVNPLFNNIKSNHFEMNNLVKLRDTLLPKLMSGEIDVSNVML